MRRPEGRRIRWRDIVRSERFNILAGPGFIKVTLIFSVNEHFYYINKAKISNITIRLP